MVSIIGKIFKCCLLLGKSHTEQLEWKQLLLPTLPYLLHMEQIYNRKNLI